MYTLNEKRVELAHLLTTYEKTKLCSVGLSGRKETVVVSEHVGDVGSFDPYIAEEITLGTNRNHDLVASTECTDVVHALRFDGKVRMTLIVLAEERDLRVTRDVGILGTLGDKINQRSRHLLINDIKNWARRCSK